MAYYTDVRKYFDELYMHGSKKKILFEGDSWFSIPDIANIPIQFDSRLDLSILCLADPGDTLEELAEGMQFKRMESLIKDDRYGQKWDALIFSAGGNDVIGPQIKKLLKKPVNPSSTDPNDYLDQEVTNTTLSTIKKRLIAIKNVRDRSKINATTPMLIHTYNYLTPRNIPHEIIVWKMSGPWIFPYMASLGIIDCAIQQAIVATLLDKFHELLQGMENEPHSNFHIIDTRTALAPVRCEERTTSFEYWRDEIHPSSKGFALITKNYFIPYLQNGGWI